MFRNDFDMVMRESFKRQVSFFTDVGNATIRDLESTGLNVG